MSVIPFPVSPEPSRSQLDHARAIVTQPELYGHRPQILRIAWATLKAARGQRMIQHRLGTRHPFSGDAA